MAVLLNHQQLQQRYAEIIPDGFHCPASLEVMQNPVIHKGCGNSFEQAVIVDWLQRSQTCMTCRADATMADFVVNRNLADGIEGMSNVFNRLGITEDQRDQNAQERNQAVQQRDQVVQENVGLVQERDQAAQHRDQVVAQNAGLQANVAQLGNANQALAAGFRPAFLHNCPIEAEKLTQQVRLSQDLRQRAFEVYNASERAFRGFVNEHHFVGYRRIYDSKTDFYNYFKARVGVEGDLVEKARLQRDLDKISERSFWDPVNRSIDNIFYGLGFNPFNDDRYKDYKAVTSTVFLDMALGENPYNAHEATDLDGYRYSSYLVNDRERYIEVSKDRVDHVATRLQEYIDKTNAVIALIPRASGDLDSIQKRINDNKRLLKKSHEALDALEKTNFILRMLSWSPWRSGGNKLLFMTDRQIEQLTETTRIRDQIRQRILLAKVEMRGISNPYVPVDEILRDHP